MELYFLYYILSGAVFSGIGFKLLFIQPNYQLEKTTSGGRIKFMDANESRKFSRIRIIGKLVVVLGILVFFIGLYVCLFADN
jgi:hypothetical protein